MLCKNSRKNLENFRNFNISHNSINRRLTRSLKVPSFYLGSSGKKNIRYLAKKNKKNSMFQKDFEFWMKVDS